MRLPFCLIRGALLPASLCLGTLAQAEAPDAHAHMDMPEKAPSAAHWLRWSDPASWPDGKVPGAGDAVIIARDKAILLDVTPPALRSLTINGELSFADEHDIGLTTDWIYLLGGELDIGSEARPYTHQATITLTDTVPNEDINTMGDRGIMMLNGTLSLHGNRGTNTWTKLAHTAKAGSSRIDVLNAAGWHKGDAIVLASTDFDPRQAEERTVTAVSGNALTLDQPLKYMHFGQITEGVDERGEVGLLSRNILIQSSPDSEKTYFGGHIMAMPGSTMFISGVELNRMGQNMHLARYPVHWHIIGDAPGQYVENSSIHDTYSRCVTIHGTNDVRVQNNVTYNTVGHCFFLEDGIEHGNQFIHNLAIQTKCHPTKPCVPVNLAANGELDPSYPNRAAIRQASFSKKDTLLPSDNTVASFWITNPDNSFIDNVAAGSDENGFWLSMPEHPQGAFKDAAVSKTIWPRRTPFRAFRGNVAHSNFDGFMFDRNINEDNTFDLSFSAFTPLANPADPNSEMVETHFDNLTSYKNRNGGVWTRGELLVFRNAKLADNAIGMTNSTGTFGSERFTARLVDSLVVGETGNIGNPATPEEIAYGRSVPKPQIPDFPIRGFEYYDYRVDAVNTTFVNFRDNAVRKTGALSWLLFTGAGVSTESTVSGAKYINAKPVYFPKIDSRFDNDNRGGSAYRTAAIHDLDGSTTGIPNSYVLINDGANDSVVTDGTCKIQPTWNASVCKGDVGRLFFRANQLAALSQGAGKGRGGFNFGYVRPVFPPAGAARPTPPPPQPPIALVRNGKEFHITADQSTVRAGSEIEVRTERPQVTLSLTEMDQGSWVVFELPGFANAASGTEQASLDALRKARETSWFRDSDTLWVKLVVTKPPVTPIQPSNIQASIAVSRGQAVAGGTASSRGVNTAGNS
jgi:cell migration-inducing and hyaluronan-binding protein